MSDELEKKRAELRENSRRLHGAPRESVGAELERVAAWCLERDVKSDDYGEGEHLQAFDARVAAMLGYPSSRFLPSGTMAQQIAMRIWADRTGIAIFGMHPTCHLELHEERGYHRLHGLGAVLVGSTERPMTAKDLAEVAEPLCALVVELPTRENGGQLPPWDDLIELCAMARDRGTHTHLDGARLWEAAAGYGRSLDEICGLFDSTYVSFYKGIGALPGSMLLGDDDFIDEARIWQRRHGGNLYSLLANWASADMRLDDRITMMPSYCERAREVAAALALADRVRINPHEPHVNMFHVFIDGDADALLIERDRIAIDHDLWLFGDLTPTELPGTQKFELTIGDAALALDLDEIAAAFTSLLQA